MLEWLTETEILFIFMLFPFIRFPNCIDSWLKATLPFGSKYDDSLQLLSNPGRYVAGYLASRSTWCTQFINDTRQQNASFALPVTPRKCALRVMCNMRRPIVKNL